jgi:hypothetical protein
MICSSVNLLFRIRPPLPVEDSRCEPSSFWGAGHEILRNYRTVEEFWDFIKRELGSHAERREYVRNQFAPMLERLEARAASDVRGLPFGCTADEFFSKVVQMLMARGREREVAVFTAGKPSLTPAENEEFFDDTAPWAIRIGLPLALYEQLDAKQRSDCETTITRTAQELPRVSRDWITATSILVEIEPNPSWREVALKWLRGEGVNNQGRVRSDNMPTREVDGLLFRSPPEVFLYRALKAKGVVFAPLPVFLRGGAGYERVEPDFVVMREGAVMLVEVDGDTFHVESPAEADRRTRMFKIEGAYIERVRARECDTPEKADSTAQRILLEFKQWRATR